MPGTKRHYVLRFPRVVETDARPQERMGQYAADRRANASLRSEVGRWIESSQLTEHVELLPTGKVSTVLFVAADAVGERALRAAPFDADVGLVDEVEIDLLSR